MIYRRFIKRILDFTISLISLIIFSPIFIVVVVLVRVKLGSPVFFCQKRPGKDEKIFKIIKFKTMTDERGTDGNLLPDKERLTKVGKFVRSTSIDELPQLINVLKGDMALIGPRPLLVRYLPYYTKCEKKRHFVRPGITGLAQVNGRNNLDWNTKLEMDVHYVEKLTFCLDLKIIYLTIYKVIKREGVVVDKKENYLDIEREKLTEKK